MLLNTPTSVEPPCRRRRALTIGCGLLALSVSGLGIGPHAAAAPVTEKMTTDEPNKADGANDGTKKDAKKPAAHSLPEPLPGVDLQELLRQFGLSDEQFRTLTGQLPDDNMLKELMEERARVLQQLQGLLGNPGTLPGAPSKPGATRRPEGRLGVAVSQPGPTLADQLDLPKGQGLAIEEVRSDSAAARVGLKAHDILLELDGKPVSSDLADFQRKLAATPANKAVDIVILRRGRRETLKGLQLPQAKEMRPGVGFGATGFDNLRDLPLGLGTGLGLGIGGGLGGLPGGAQLPAIPEAPAAGVFQGDGAIKLFVPGSGGKGGMTTTFRTDDRFTSRHEEGSLVITVTGKVEDGQAKVMEINVQDGRESHKYESLDKVPEAYRDKAKHLVASVIKENVRIRTNEFDGIRPSSHK
jgi:PDZ domain